MAPRKMSEKNATTVRPQEGRGKKRNKGITGGYGEEYIGRGKCSPAACNPEAACKPLSDKTYTCICPQDSSLPIIIGDDFTCPRRIVPIDPHPIHNIMPPVWPTNLTKTTEPDKSDSVTEPDVLSVTTTTIVAGVALLAGFSVITIAVICLIRRYHSPSCMSLKDKKRTKHQSATPVSLSKGLLDADRYTTNPQYFAAAPELTLPSLSVPMLPKENIMFHQIIGEGCFGKVYKGELTNEFGEIETIAIKVLKESANKETEEDFMREVGVMSSFQHSNILSLLGVTYKEPEKSPCMVFEFMPHGDLTEVLRSNSRHFWKPDSIVPRLNKESLLYIAIQIASGMQYLAGQHFVHRDLACRNCLVGTNLTVKIADFGMSRDVYTCDYYKIGGSRLLPVRWMSPESVTYGRFTLESDIWSYGVVLWEIYSLGKQPYYGHSNEEVVKLILQGIMLIPPEDCPATICEIMETCWKTEPRDRATFTDIYHRLLQISLSSGASHHIPLAVDCEDYLKPQPPQKPHEYMQPLPD